jgi:hypothetical protein
MIVELFTTKERLPFIQKKLGDKVVVLEEGGVLGYKDNDHIKIQIILESGIDALCLFHAGVDFGMDQGLKLYK